MNPVFCKTMNYLRALRMAPERHMRQRALAGVLGMVAQEVCRFEHGDKSPSLTFITRYVDGVNRASNKQLSEEEWIGLFSVAVQDLCTTASQALGCNVGPVIAISGGSDNVKAFDIGGYTVTISITQESSKRRKVALTE